MPNVDDIVFGSPNKSFNDEFAALMTEKFEMSMMGEEVLSWVRSQTKKRRNFHQPSQVYPRHAQEIQAR